MLGHFDGGRAAGDEVAHVDWLHSGAKFDRERFDTMTRAIVEGMLGAAS